MNIGDKITCHDSESSRFLETNRTYEIIDKNYLNNIRIQDIQDGEISTHYYKPSRFSIVYIQPEKQSTNCIDITKEYTTRNGLEVQIMGKSKVLDFPIVGCYKDNEGNWRNESWRENGRFLYNEDNDIDLIEKKKDIRLSYLGLEVIIKADQTAIINQRSYSKGVMKQIFDVWNSFA